MEKRFNITKEELYKLFIIKNMRRNDVAKFYGCSSVLIKKKCQEYNIKKSKKLENKNKERKVNINCIKCGKEFNVVKFRGYGKWKFKFCSTSCSSNFRYKGLHNRRELYRKHGRIRYNNMKIASLGLSKEEKLLINEFYKNRPYGYEVDHIIPISKRR